MSDDRTLASIGEEEHAQRPPLIAGLREPEMQSALAARTLWRRSFAASVAVHAGLVLALLLLALSPAPPPEEKVLKVTLLSEGPGAAGASGGEHGGGGAAPTSSVPEAAPSAAAPAEAAPAPPPEPAPAPAPPTPAPPPQMAAATPPPEAPPPPPRRKPPPPRRAARTPAPSAPLTPPTLPEPQQLATAPATQPIPGEPGTGSGPGTAAGVGTGAEGAGHGAVGDGPIAGPGDDYLDRLRRWLNKYKRYPEAAKKDKQQGRLVVGFTVLRDGTVVDPYIEHSSGFPLLDEAALKMLRDASPVPPLPERYRASRLVIALPVDYSIGLFDKMF